MVRGATGAGAGTEALSRLKSALRRSADFNRLTPSDNPEAANMNHAPENAQPDKPTKSRRSLSSPPYNPGLQQLGDGKQAWADPLAEEAKAQGFLGWHQRGYLPQI